MAKLFELLCELIPSERTLMFYGCILGLVILYTVGSNSGKDEVKAACDDYGEVKIDGKMYVCKEKMLSYRTLQDLICFQSSR